MASNPPVVYIYIYLFAITGLGTGSGYGSLIDWLFTFQSDRCFYYSIHTDTYLLVLL